MILLPHFHVCIRFGVQTVGASFEEGPRCLSARRYYRVVSRSPDYHFRRRLVGFRRRAAIRRYFRGEMAAERPLLLTVDSSGGGRVLFVTFFFPLRGGERTNARLFVLHTLLSRRGFLVPFHLGNCDMFSGILFYYGFRLLFVCIVCFSGPGRIRLVGNKISVPRVKARDVVHFKSRFIVWEPLEKAASTLFILAVFRC